MKTAKVCTDRLLRQSLSLSSRAALVAAGILGLTTPAAAQLLGTTTTSTNNNQTPTPITVRLIEWDLPQQMDNSPGAMVVDVQGNRGRLWFVTRTALPDSPRVYRVDFRNDKKNKNTADWLSWELQPPASASVANGLRRIRSSKDGRFVFVHSTTSLIRIDTQDCKPIQTSIMIAGFNPTAECTRTTWPHDQINDTDHPSNPSTGSDVSIDDSNKIFSSVASLDPTSLSPDPGRSFIQRLITTTASNNVTRWYVGGNAGLCATAVDSSPCLSGVDIDRSGRFVYFSMPEGGANGQGAIGELDTRICSGLSGTCTIRVWPFSGLAAQPPVTEPRHLQIDDDGKIWVVTGSGHLVSLDPKKNRMTTHFVPDVSHDLFGVAPDSNVIGFTNSDATENKVGLLAPNRNFAMVKPDTPTIAFKTFTGNFVTDQANRTNGQTSPCRKTAMGQRTPTADGTFVEADIATGMPERGANCDPENLPPSAVPLGITPDRSSRVGTFFYAVGNPGDPTFNRIGRAKFPRNAIRARIERDDDDFDDDGKRGDVDDDVDDDEIPNAMDADSDNDGNPDVSDDDDDDDGIDDASDAKDKKETKQTSQQDVVAGDAALDTFTTNPGTLLVVASATSSDALASVTVEVVDSLGQVVASSLPTPGTSAVTFVPPSGGGTYTLRVKNLSIGLSTISTKILMRELWPVVLAGGL